MAITSKMVKPLPELVYTRADDAAHTRWVSRQAAEGRLAKLYAGVYTGNLASPLEAVVTRNWADIVGHLLPGAVLGYRSAASGKPEDGVVYVTRGRTRRQLALPGLRIEVLPGHGAVDMPMARDTPYKQVYLASEPRWLLENLSRGRGLAARVLPQSAIEQRLERILLLRGEPGLNTLRDVARQLADTLGMVKQFSRLDGLIGALLGSHAKAKLQSKVALARAAGMPYDPERVDLFDTVFSYLRSEVMPEVPEVASRGAAVETFAFFEAYFSNYIEGTTFEVNEAASICFQGAIVPGRSEDSHDILGTFRAAVAAPWRNQPAADAEAFLAWLKAVNAQIMAARPDKRPGEWKEKANQAGNTVFVHPGLVPGTLREGHARIAALDHPLMRALMAMFVVTETHPFADGNGRTARLAMNCELSAGGLSRIIIPTVYREDYLLPLKSLSNQSDPVPYLRAMARIQRWSAAFDYGLPRERLTEQLGACHAFKEDLRHYRLLFPEEAKARSADNPA